MFLKAASWFVRKEKFFFLAVLLVNLYSVLDNRFYPTMDGPAHLHNAYLLKELALGSDFVSHYYSVNTIPIPNWTNHFLQAFLLLFLSPNLTEQFTFVLYVLLLSLSFRYFVKQIQPSNLAASILIFPFLFSFLLHLGFINFCFSIGFMFLGLGYYLKNKNKINFNKGVILSLIILFSYFSNVFGFVYLLFFIYSFCFVEHFSKAEKLSKGSISEFIKKYIVLFMVSAIPLICLLVFYNTVVFFPSGFQRERYELLNWISDIRPLIVYIYKEDEEFLHLLFVFLIASFSIAVFNFYKKESRFKSSIHLVLLSTVFVTYLLLLKVPDGSSAGMMSDRLCLMLYFVFLATLIAFPIPRTILLLAAVITVFVNVSIYFFNHSRIIKSYSDHADTMVELSEKINEKSIVLPINIDADWMEGHFSNYAGLNKEIVILENYEAQIGWFPLKWNVNNMPKFILGTKQTVSNIYWTTNTNSKTEKKIDYVLIFGTPSKVNQPEFSELKSELSTFYDLIDGTSPYVNLYKLKK